MQNRIILLPMKTQNPIRWMLAALLVIAFISCGKRTPKYVIGVSQCSEDIWRKKMNDELRIATISPTATWNCASSQPTMMWTHR